MRKVSKKMAKTNRTYTKLRKDFLLEHPMCQVKDNVIQLYMIIYKKPKNMTLVIQGKGKRMSVVKKKTSLNQKCTKCHELKSLNDFYTDKRQLNNCQSECKKCAGARKFPPPGVTTKKCFTCKRVRALSNFYKKKSGVYGLAPQCIECYKEYYKKYIKKNSSTFNKRQRLYHRKWRSYEENRKYELNSDHYIAYNLYRDTILTRKDLPAELIELKRKQLKP